MKIQFCGAAQSVTGSCNLIECEHGKILVDCGMRQGADKKMAYGEDKFPFEPSSIDALLLTHAHIDHSGLIPLLVKKGFKGKVIATKATVKLAEIMLPDSAHIQEQDAEYLNRKRLRAGKPVEEPLYTLKDVEIALKQFKPVNYDDIVQVIPGIKARFSDIGHLLGSSAIEVWAEESSKTTKIAFSGDVGRSERPIIRDPGYIDSADYLLLESTYGDRNHEISTDEDKLNEFANILRAAIIRGGNIIIPSFAVGRTQEILYYIKKLLMRGTVPGLSEMPVYLDSPLGIEATRVYESCAKDYFDEEALELLKQGPLFDFPTLNISKTSEESKLLNVTKESKIIISSSGMCDAGRIRHHLKHNLYRADSTVIFTGYQAVGTLGRILLDGAQKVKLFGEEVRVNAAIKQIEGFSGHAGKDELIDWIGKLKNKPQKLFLIHGEPEVLKNFGQTLSELGYSIEIPELGDIYDLKDSRIHAAAETVHVKPVAVVAQSHDAQIKSQIDSLLGLLDKIEEPYTEQILTKLKFLEADLEALVDKWQKLL